jgi:hypothetical protein
MRRVKISSGLWRKVVMLQHKKSQSQTHKNAEVVADLVLQLSLQQLNEGLSTSDSLETKATGIIAFSAILIGIIMSFRWGILVLVPSSLLILSMVMSMWALWVSKFEYGPDSPSFYNEFALKASPLDAKLLMTEGLDNAFNHNGIVIRKKGLRINLALIFLILTLISVVILYFVEEGVDRANVKQFTNTSASTTQTSSKVNNKHSARNVSKPTYPAKGT